MPETAHAADPAFPQSFDYYGTRKNRKRILARPHFDKQESNIWNEKESEGAQEPTKIVYVPNQHAKNEVAERGIDSQAYLICLAFSRAQQKDNCSIAVKQQKQAIQLIEVRKNELAAYYHTDKTGHLKKSNREQVKAKYMN
jgi:hypothetical protein